MKDFEGKKWKITFWKSRGIVVFGVKCFNCDATKSYLRNNPALNNDDIEVMSCKYHVYSDTLYNLPVVAIRAGFSASSLYAGKVGLPS